MPAMPMFPLGMVLVPGAVLPLHVFEPRYRRLVQDCLASSAPEFGVTLIERGSEVGGGDVRSTWGTVARMVEVGESDDGRYAVVCVGVRRIRVLAWLPDDPYPLADVEDWPEGEAAVGWQDIVARVVPRVRAALALSVELGDQVADPSVAIADDPVLASHQLVGMAPIGPTDRHALLGAATPTERLERLEALLDDVEALLGFRLGTDLDDDPDDPRGDPRDDDPDGA